MSNIVENQPKTNTAKVKMRKDSEKANEKRPRKVFKAKPLHEDDEEFLVHNRFFFNK
jgi:hypothetical protein